MPDYRLYCMDAAGHIQRADWVYAGDDDDAVRKACVMRPEANHCEIWDGGRLVAEFSPTDPPEGSTP